MKKILLIEDNDDIRNNTAEILEISNYEVIVAENGKIGVKKAIEQFFDTVPLNISSHTFSLSPFLSFSLDRTWHQK